MCVFAYMYICVCIAIVHIRTVLIFAICYIQLFMATLMVTPSPLLGSVSMKACTLHLSLLRPPLPADYRIRFNFRRVKLLWRAVYILPADYVVITNRKDPTLSRPRREDGEPIKQIILPHTQLRGGRGGGGAGVQEGTEASSPQACSVLEAPVTLLCSRRCLPPEALGEQDGAYSSWMVR